MKPPYIERTNYFAGETLLTEDFICEQRYHMETLRQNNCALYTCGIAHGLEVHWDPKSSANQVSINPGMALDREGRQIVLLAPLVLTLDAVEPDARYFVTIHYAEAASDYSDEGGASGYKRTIQQARIDYLCNLPDPGLYIVLAVLDFSAVGSINRLSYKSGEFERRYVGSVLGSLHLVNQGAGLSRSKSFSALGGFIDAPLAADASISARQQSADGASYLLVDAARTQVSGVLSTHGNLGVGVDHPGASLQVDATLVNGGAVLLRSVGPEVTLSGLFLPFFEVGDILVSDPSVGQGPSQKRRVIGIDAGRNLVTVDKAFIPPLDNIGFTYLRATLARFGASNGLIGNGSLLEIGVDGSIGMGLQASLSDGAASSGAHALVVSPERRVGINLTGGSPRAELDVKGQVRADSVLVNGAVVLEGDHGDLTVSGRIIANSFEGNGAMLKNLPILSFWNKETAGSDTSNLYYNSGNVGVRCTEYPASFNVGGGRPFVGSGLISRTPSALPATGKVTIKGYQTSFSRQVSVGDTIATGELVEQRQVVAALISDTQLQLKEQFAIPVTSTLYSIESPGAKPAAGPGVISSNGTLIDCPGGGLAGKVHAGDTLVIHSFEAHAVMPLFVTNVGSDIELTLSARGGDLDAAAGFAALVSAYIVTPAILGHFKAENGDPDMLPALVIATNGGGALGPANTVAINVALSELDNQYALQVNGDVKFGGNTHFSELTVDTLTATVATIDGSLNATQGTVSMFGNWQALTPGSFEQPNWFTATTDGLVVGNVSWPSSWDPGCKGWVVAETLGVCAYATGGNNTGDSFTLPVSANGTFLLYALQIGNTAVPISAWWVPLGGGSATSCLAAEADAAGVRVPPPMPDPAERTESHERIVAVLEDILGKTLDAGQRAALGAAFSR